MTKEQLTAIAQITGTFDAARKLQCHPREPIFVNLIKEYIGNDEDLKVKANKMWAEYDKEFKTIKVSNGTTEK
jgi:hypothetical protein